MSDFQSPVRTFQIWSNEFAEGRSLPLQPLAVRAEPTTHTPNKPTAARVVEIKRCMGYTERYATPEITDALLRQLQRPTLRSLFTPVQWERGLRYRRNLRNNPQGRAELAKAILNHKNAVFAFSSPTGGTARAGLVAASEGRKSYVKATGQFVYIDEKILRFILECCKRGRTLINCVVNGRHRVKSEHYYGHAADIDTSSDTDTEAAAEASGCRVLHEDQNHDHGYSGAKP